MPTKRMTSVSSVSDDDKTLLTGWTIGSTQFFRGEWVEAHDRFERAARVYDQQRHRAIASLVGHDLCVPCLFAYMTRCDFVSSWLSRTRGKELSGITLAGAPARTSFYPCRMAQHRRHVFLHSPRIQPLARSHSRDYHRRRARVRGFTFYEETIGAFEIIGLAAEGKIEELKEAVSRSKPYSAASSELGGTWARSALATSRGAG